MPDCLFIEGDTAFLLNPSEEDESVYSYGTGHPIYEGRYRTDAWSLNDITVEGWDSGGSKKIIKDSFAWDELTKGQVRAMRVIDRNIGSAAEAADRGETYLKKAEAESVSGYIDVPVNCGQQLYDIIDITDERAGLEEEKRRVVMIDLEFNSGRGTYRQRLVLKGV